MPFLADKYGMLALSIRQPYAELILRGIKTVTPRKLKGHPQPVWWTPF